MTSIEAKSGGHVVAGLTEVVHALGAELRNASATTSEETLMFGGAEVEMDVAVEATASGGFNFWVVNLDGGTTYTRTARVKVTLYPGSDEGLPMGK